MSTLTLRLFDGARRPFTPASNLLITLTDGNQTQQIRQFDDANAITFNDLPFFDRVQPALHHRLRQAAPKTILADLRTLSCACGRTRISCITRVIAVCSTIGR
jgi:hypothetical protein